MENPIEMDDLRIPLFLETPIYLGRPYYASLICPKKSYESNKILSSWTSGCTVTVYPSPCLLHQVYHPENQRLDEHPR